MRISGFVRGALTSCATAAMLAGCDAQSVVPQSHAIAPPATRALSALPDWSYRVVLQFYHYRGKQPAAPLLNVNGTLYGTTQSGGRFRRGTVYSVSPRGAHAVLHSFSGGNDGAAPQAGLIDANGTLYGTTLYGGTPNQGTVYSISTSGSEKVLYSFTGGADGGFPLAPLIYVNGTFYGTTLYGGKLTCRGYKPGCGTVYSVTPKGLEKVLHNFSSGSDGAFPQAGLLNENGTLYGTTSSGGTRCKNAYSPCGTVYKISTTGAEKVLYRFTGGSNGAQPEAPLIDVKGTLYGTTNAGGGTGCDDPSQHLGCGTVYSVSTTGTENVVYRFAGGTNDGASPGSGLIDVKGTLYGTTWFGGAFCHDALCGPGTIYRVSTSGAEKVLYRFSGSDGENPDAALIDMNGVLYGTTANGGHMGCKHNNGCGTVFALSQ